MSCKSYATELQDSNKTSYNSPDFYPQYKKTSISINGFKVLLALASTDEQRIKGLSGLEKLNENEGMLFLFDKPSKQGFWMNEMKFPIDILWLDSDSRVVHIEKKFGTMYNIRDLSCLYSAGGFAICTGTSFGLY